jgi:site-specific recombinase XerD
MMDGQIAQQSPRALDLKAQRLGYFVSWCEKQEIADLLAVTPNAVRAFVVHLQGLRAHELNPRVPARDKPFAALTIKGYVRVVKAFFAWCKREGLLFDHEDPTARLPRVKVPHYVIPTFTPEQMAAMLDACDVTTALGFRDYVLLLMLMDTGIRVSELCGLTLDGVHEGYITVFGKGSKEREVGIGPTVSRALWKYLHQFRRPRAERDTRVCLGANSLPMTRNGVYQALRRIGERAGIEGVRLSPHTFRHSFARMWLENGGELFNLSRILGHTEVSTTQTYLKDFQSREARAGHTLYSPVERLRLGRGKEPPKRRG